METINYKGFQIKTDNHCSIIYKNGHPVGGSSTDYTTSDLSNKNYIATPINNSLEKAKKKIDLM